MVRHTRRGFLGMTGLAAGLAWCGRSDGATGRSGEAFSIAALNDHHVTDAGSTDIVSLAVAAVNALDSVRFAVVLGDLTDEAKPEQFDWVRDALAAFEKPYRVIPGDHDVTSKALSGYQEYLRRFEDTNWVYEHGGWTFLGIDSCEGRSPVVKVPLRTVLWLNERLREIPTDRPLALFLHHPMIPSLPQIRVRNADTILANFGDHRLKLVASGHFHANFEERQDGVLFTTTACCSTSKPNHDLSITKGFRLFHFRDGEVETEFVGMGPWPKSAPNLPATGNPA